MVLEDNVVGTTEALASFLRPRNRHLMLNSCCCFPKSFV